MEYSEMTQNKNKKIMLDILLFFYNTNCSIFSYQISFEIYV